MRDKGEVRGGEGESRGSRSNKETEGESKEGEADSYIKILKCRNASEMN